MRSLGPVSARCAAVLLAVFGLLVLGERTAAGARFHVRSRTVGQGYQQLTSDRGLLNRRRITQSLGLSVHDLTGDDSDRLHLVTELRLDSDFSLSEEEEDRTRGLRNHELTLLLGYVEGRELIPWTDFRLGRQLLTDPASDLTLMDGLHLAVRSPWYVGVEAAVGLESKEGAITGTELELDGVEDHRGHTIIAGGALVLHGVRDVAARVDYQHWWTDGDTDREVIAGSVWWRPLPWLSAGGDVRWDFVVSTVDSARADLRLRPWEPMELAFAYEHYRPVFRADSIWNVFAADAFDEIGGTVRFRWGRLSSLYFGAGARLYGTAGLVGGDTDVMFRGGAELGSGEKTTLRFDAMREGRSGGTFVLADLGLRHTFGEDRGGLEGRLTVVRREDPVRDLPSLNAFGIQLGGWFRVRDVATFHLMIEDNESSRQAHALRIMAIADVSLWM